MLRLIFISLSNLIKASCRPLLLLCLILSGVKQASAQGEDNVWIFGNHCGIDFNGGAPVAISSAMTMQEGSASICDAQGQLLFYTNSMKIWDRNHDVMPNGNGLATVMCESTTQAALIVPIPDSPSLYYVFSLEAFVGRLFYSVVDMSLNGGNGDVIPARKNIQLTYGLTEKMIAIRGNDCNVWVLVHELTSQTFKAYSITKSGISAPVISVSGTIPTGTGWPELTNYAMGAMKITPDRKKLVLANFFEPTELYDFDPNTGIVSNAANLGSNSKAYGACFSPDGTKLYLTTNYFDGGGPYEDLIQYDVTMPTTADIQNSRTPVFNFATPNYPTGFGAMKNGPDGKIYISLALRPALASIDDPNQPGILCQVTGTAITLTDTAMYGLPNDIVSAGPVNTVSTVFDLPYCFEQPVRLEALPGYAYQWADGNIDSVRIVTTPGVYVVTYKTSPCEIRTDSFKVSFLNPVPVITKANVHCVSASFIVDPITDTSEYTYNWIAANGDTLRTHSNSTTGDTLVYPVPEAGVYTYFVHMQHANGCDTLLSVTDTLEFAPLYLSDVTADTTISFGSSVQLNASGAQYYTWVPDKWLDYPNAADPVASPQEPVAFSVIGINSYGCRDTAIVRVGIDYAMEGFVPTAFSPDGDGLNDIFSVKHLSYQKLLEFRIYNRWGEQIFSSTDARTGWDGTYKGQPQETGAYHYLIRISLPDGGQRSFKGQVMLVR